MQWSICSDLPVFVSRFRATSSGAPEAAHEREGCLLGADAQGVS